MNSQDIKSELVSNLRATNQILEGVVRALKRPKLNDLYSSYKDQLNELAKEEFLVAVTGTVSAGKSSFVNALLGRNILTRSEKTTTKVATKIRSISDSPNGKECFVATVKYPEISKEFEDEFLREFYIFYENPHTNINTKKYFERFVQNIINIPSDFNNFLIELNNNIDRSNNNIDHFSKVSEFVNAPRLKDIFESVRSKFPINYINKDVKNSIGKLEPFLTNSIGIGSVTDICVYVDSPILSRGVTLVDLPGSDARFDDDKKITHGVLNDKALSAVIFTYVFGKDALSEDAVIADYINNNILKKGNKLFLVFNKSDKALDSVETRNTHINETLQYFDSKFKTRNDDQVQYYYLSAALNEGMSFGINPNGEMLQDHDKIINEIKRIAKEDHKLKESKKSEGYQHFFNAFASCLKQLPKFKRPLTGIDDQEGVLGVLDELSPEDLISIYNLEGLNEIVSCVDPNRTGMSNLYKTLFDYLTEDRIIEVYERVLSDWNALIVELRDSLSETTSKLDSFGPLKAYKREQKRDFKNAMSDLSNKASEISQRFHQRKGAEIDIDIRDLLDNFKNELSDVLSNATKSISYEEIVSALKSEYQQRSAIPSYLEKFASNYEIKGYEFAYKQENIYAEAVLLALINALQMLTRYKSREMIKNLPERVLSHLGSWLREEDTQAEYFTDLSKILNLDYPDLSNDFIKMIEESQIYEKTLDGIDGLLHKLYHQSGTKSIYSHLLDGRESDVVQNMIANLDKTSNFTEIKRVFDEINTEQIKVGFNQFKDGVERYLRDWNSQILTPFFSDLFNEDGNLYKNYQEILEESLEINHKKQLADFNLLCTILERSKDELKNAIGNAKDCYRDLRIKYNKNSLRDFEDIDNVLNRLLKIYAELEEL